MSLNYESAVINGQLVPVAPAQAFAPLTYGAQYSGPGFWPAGNQYSVPPLLPNPTALTGSTAFSPDMGGEGGSMSGDGQPVPTSGSVKNGKVNWFHPTKSPVLWAFGLLALSLFLLHKVHYGK